ncbi:hypothetical protein ASF61_06735 [Duganella sp. Leaf126]|uniref:hypothetical protein n=1 Tax=Duganella sp. Leaf126 TaxID=1736266 RepID=UPI0006F7AC02|nr:hypothetical protein [Duganella sp. Leaf126]KQQ40444.1 hypothetical protein ASF61_06735 [Duganella sp. Leaf126]
MKADHPLTARRIAAITAALQAGPLCAHDLAPKVFLCFEQARRYLQFMQAQGLAHIAKWPLRCTPRATRVAAYALGGGADAKKPARRTGQQRQARAKAKLRADAERYEFHLAKCRARKRKAARDPLVAAMFGSTVESRP